MDGADNTLMPLVVHTCDLDERMYITISGRQLFESLRTVLTTLCPGRDLFDSLRYNVDDVIVVEFLVNGLVDDSVLPYIPYLTPDDILAYPVCVGGSNIHLRLSMCSRDCLEETGQVKVLPATLPRTYYMIKRRRPHLRSASCQNLYCNGKFQPGHPARIRCPVCRVAVYCGKFCLRTDQYYHHRLCAQYAFWPVLPSRTANPHKFMIRCPDPFTVWWYECTIPRWRRKCCMNCRVMCRVYLYTPAHPNLLRCGRCRRVRYCNKVCQTADWVRHRPECKQLREHNRPSPTPVYRIWSVLGSCDLEECVDSVKMRSSWIGFERVHCRHVIVIKTLGQCIVCQSRTDSFCNCGHVQYCSDICKRRDVSRHGVECLEQQEDNRPLNVIHPNNR
jgi:hypothetical protein